MIVDTSAIIAILRAEPDARRYADALESAEVCSLSAVTYVEAAVVMDSARDLIVSRRFDDFVTTANLLIADPAEIPSPLTESARTDGDSPPRPSRTAAETGR